MPSLKDFRNRIASVKSTQKITKAMKMVAAAKLRRAQEQAQAARPYAEQMDRMLASLGRGMAGRAGAPAMLAGTGSDKTHLVVVATADRGLCGGFNGSIVREARRMIRELQGQGKEVKVFAVGRKGRDFVRREFGKLMVDSVTDIGRKRLAFEEGAAVATKIQALFEAGQADVVTIVYNRFKSAMTQIVTRQQLIPPALPDVEPAAGAAAAPYEFEPDEEEILKELLPRNLAVQVYRALLENSASFYGAQMTAMDNATRNAGDVINRLTLQMNRQRQAYITKELIEIISGAEAL
jgi:F-type H+-transporting ATPase subunit gamma